MLQFHIENKTIHTVANKFRQTGSLLDKNKSESRRRMLTGERMDEVGARPEHSSQKSIRRGTVFRFSEFPKRHLTHKYKHLTEVQEIPQ
jgi:transposase